MRSFQFQVEGAIHPVIGLGGRNPWMLDPDDLASSFSLYPTAIININTSPPPDIVTLFGSFTSTTFVQASLFLVDLHTLSFFGCDHFYAAHFPSFVSYKKIYWIQKNRIQQKATTDPEIDHHPCRHLKDRHRETKTDHQNEVHENSPSTPLITRSYTGHLHLYRGRSTK